MKKIVKVLIAIVAIFAVLGITAGVILLFKKNSNSGKTVAVYEVSEIGMSGSEFGDMGSDYSGTVTNSRQQEIYLYDEKKVKEVYVKQGDNVKKGDLLLLFDAKEVELELELKRSEVAIAQAEVKRLESELERLKNITPIDPDVPIPTPSDPEDDDDDDDDDEPEEYYTEEELEEEIRSVIAELKEAQIDAQLEEIEYEMMLYQNSDMEVHALFDGVVKTLNTNEEELDDGEPYLVVSTSKGYTVNTTIGESLLTKVKVGDKVSMTSYDNGQLYTGVVSDIGIIPQKNYGYSAYDQSYYPVKISIDDEKDIEQDMYMGIIYSASDEVKDGESFYLSMPFVKKEGSNYYVMKDDNGILVKQYVETGAILWGSEIEIKSGLNFSDKIAFPFSSVAKEGTKTREGSVDELY